jgi:hypothetical protein
MAIEVNFDPLDAPAVLNLGPNGWTGTRFADVTGLVIGRDRLPEDASILLVAVQQVRKRANPGVHSYPGVPELPVHDLSAVLRDDQKTMARVTINYRVPDVFTEQVDPDPNAPPQLEIGATIQQRQTIYDGDGKQIVIERTVENTTTQTTDVLKQTGTITEQVPQAVIRYRRRMGPNLGPVIRNQANEFVGTVNSGAFAENANTFPNLTRQWMCTGITGTSTDGGVYYDVTYEFQRNIDNKLGSGTEYVSGWDPVAVYINPKTGEPPTDVITPNGGPDDHNGIKRITKPRGKNFISGLDL